MALPQIRSGLPWGQQAITLINNAIGKIVDASTTVAGLVKLATNSDTVTGTATDTATTPAGVKAVIDALKAAANTWTAAQTISVTAAGTALQISSSDAGASAGPNIILFRNSASPVASDVLGQLLFSGNDSGGNFTNYIYLRPVILDATDASEDGQLQLRGAVAGSDTAIVIFGPGVQIGSPTGGDKGAGTLNLDNDLYKDGTKVVGARKTGWSTATGTASRATFDTATVTTAQLAQRVKALIDDLEATAGHGLIGA